MPDVIARLWFIPGDGIDRRVITSDIQRYLGNDATVRPGLGTDEHEGVEGYWIKAQRNLTSYQVEDLRTASAKFRHELAQRPGSSRNYVDSHTYHHQGGNRAAGRGGDSPITADPGYGAAPPRREPPREQRMPSAQIPHDEMDVDYGPPPPRRFENDRPNYGADRPPFHENWTQHQEPAFHRGQPAPYGYAEPRDPRDYRDPRDARDQRDPRDLRDMRDPRADLRADPRADPRHDQRGGLQYAGGPQPGPYQQGRDTAAYYPPNNGAYGGPPMNAPMQPPYGSNGYGPGPGPGPSPRETGREPRYGGPPSYANDPGRDPRNAEARYAYPSPPVTIVDTRDTSPNTVPPSGYQPGPGQGPTQPRYYDDGRPQAAPGVHFSPGPPAPGPFGAAIITGPSRGPSQGQRPLMTTENGPDARRRRLN